MVPETALTADRDAIRRDLTWMMDGWDRLGEPVRFEVRAFKEGATTQIGTFAPDWIDEAIDWIAGVNALGFNCYVVRNPIRASVVGSASDSDVVASFYLWADFDEEGAAENVRRWPGPKYSTAVITGRVPFVRVHTYWRLAEPCRDLSMWRETQSGIAAHLGSDTTVVNPSRIMRIGGTVSWPPARKRAKGYIDELTSIRTEYDEPRAPVTLDQMHRAFGQTPPQATQPRPQAGGIHIDTGWAYAPALDRDRTRIQALSGMEWHNAVIRLVASYVARGLSDDEIHGLTDPLTLQGYTVDQTRAEVQKAINGARRKGWTPEAQDEQFREMTPEEKAAVPGLPFKPWGQRDLAAIPHQQFVYSDFYARGYTSLTVAPPKVGKSMLGLCEAVDIASGRGILTAAERDPLRVLYYNAEDDQSVLDARVAALLCHYSIEQAEIAETLYPVSGVDADGFYLIGGAEGVINEALFVALERFVADNRIDVLIFDPLQDMSSSPETNEVFRALGRRLRRFASANQVALGLIHHTRKMAPGVSATIDDARGGSALRGTARFNRLLIPMTEEEGGNARVENHRHFMRIADMESNLAPPSADVNRWFQKVSVQIPNGAFVGAIEPWNWPDAFDGISREDAYRVQSALRTMEDDPPRLDNRSATWVGYVVARVLDLDADDKATRNRIGAMVKAWVKTGVLEVIDSHDARAGRPVKTVVAGKNIPTTEYST